MHRLIFKNAPVSDHGYVVYNIYDKTKVQLGSWKNEWAQKCNGCMVSPFSTMYTFGHGNVTTHEMINPFVNGLQLVTFIIPDAGLVLETNFRGAKPMFPELRGRGVGAVWS